MGREIIDFDWEEFLLLIEDRRVIPVVGKELLVLPMDGREVLLDRWLAERLSVELGTATGELSGGLGLAEVAAEYLRLGKPRRKIYSRIRSILDHQEPLPVPEPLRLLAEIEDFQLFVSTTFDPLLGRALEAVRGVPPTVLSFSPRLEDLLQEVRELETPHVYHLLGKLSSSPDYAVTDEDTLELLHRLQSEPHRPKLLFDELRDQHLLFLGLGFPDWLARFFLRTVANDRLLSRDTFEVIADSQVHRDQRLALFLKDCQAETYAGSDVAEFVSVLHRRWKERERSGHDRNGPPMVPGSIFISYARDDAAAADCLRKSLEAEGLEVWLDSTKLKPGQAWNREIKRNIHRCSLFLALLSGTTVKRTEGYFRKEWKWAIDRAEGMSDTRRFIHPIIIDDGVEKEAKEIPEYFWTRQVHPCPEGRPCPDFVNLLIEQVRSLELQKKGLS